MGVVKKKTVLKPAGSEAPKKKKKVISEIITPICMTCPACGKMIDDRELLDEALNMRWECPFCGAQNISQNDMAAQIHFTGNPTDEDDDEDEEEENSCEITHMDPKEMQRLHEEYMKKTHL